MRARFVKKIKRSPDIQSFYFEPDIKPNFIAGQFIELTLPFTSKGHRVNKRWFSLSLSPDEKYLAITTRLYANKSKFKQNLTSLKPGAEVDISQPMGDFVLPKDAEAELAFIAVGIGITPFRSIINYLPNEKGSRDITLVFASKNPDDFIFDELLSGAKIKYIKHIGTLGLDDVKNHLPELKLKTIFVSGPEKTVETLYKKLLDDGVKPESISVDYFHNYD